jgi:hypothetical protein
MPLILIIVGVIAALVVGFMYTQNQPDTEIEVETPVVRVEDTAPAPEQSATDSNPEAPTTSDVAPETTDLDYANGSYKATGTYVTPGRSTHNVNVTLTLADDIVTGSTITFSGDTNNTSSGWQSKFSAAYQAQVVGKKLNDVSLSRVGGASLTTSAFNKALAEVKTSAQS